MKKNNTLGYAAPGILFVLLSVIAFVVPTDKTGTFWIAYAFTTLAFVIQFGIWKVAFGREDTLKSKFLGIPLVHVGIVYLIIQIIVFAVFTIVPTLPSWAAIITCVIVLGISAICMVAVETGRGEIERVETKVKSKVSYVKELQVDIELLADAETDGAIKTSLSRLAEKVCFSDSMSSEKLADLEANIAAKALELKSAADKMPIIKEIDELLTERNKKCKILK